MIEVSDGGTQVGAVRNFTCGKGRRFSVSHKPNTVVRCESRGDWVTYTGDRVDNSIEDCTEIPLSGKARHRSVQVEPEQHIVILRAIESYGSGDTGSTRAMYITHVALGSTRYS